VHCDCELAGQAVRVARSSGPRALVVAKVRRRMDRHSTGNMRELPLRR